ncbi:RHS repeat-associated core domain-containing protein [Dyella sp. SG609]|uniref:RHS repeat-associated core domain-containing protein n=1 Tax=Dyella sp. SG609 TaxID=2587018 RepID=UPI001444EE6D|nr:RHS repeat-associated core domain-containing protein [Dyella sp. SG609]NKJ21569.1 RHS repeat-associated protein [Dyella sp. SG609]
MKFLGRLIRCLAVMLWLAAPAAMAQFSVPPDVGVYDYGFVRCDVPHFGYGSRAEAEQVGANYYYKTGNCSAYVSQPGPWASNTYQTGGICGGSDVYQYFYLGVDYYSRASDGVTYTAGSGCADTYHDGMVVIMQRPAACPLGYGANDTTKLCDPAGLIDPNKNNNYCKAGCNGTDPIHSRTGIVLEHEVDYQGEGKLELSRYYSSWSGQFDTTYFGSQWRHNFSQRVSVVTSGGKTVATVYRPNGDRYHYQQDANGAWVGDADVALKLTSTVDGSGNITSWSVLGPSGEIESYNGSGLLTAIQWHDQHRLTFTYNGIRLYQVTDEKGRALTFKYGAAPYVSDQRIVEVDAPNGLAITYTYADNADVITGVKYAGTLDGNAIAIASTKTYVYADGNPSRIALVGLIDEQGQRTGTWGYDSVGRGIMYVNGAATDFARKTQLAYNGDGSTTVTNWIDGAAGLSFARTFNFNVLHGVAHIASSTCTGCTSPAIQLPGVATMPALASYDANGYPSQTKDFNNNLSTFQYDGASGLKVQEVEASGTANQRTINTTWDTALRVPLLKVSLDNQGNTFARQGWEYNSRGQVMASCEMDPQLAGSYTCTRSGTAPAGVRRWTYTYCEAVDGTQCPVLGLLLSSDGPRTDVADITTYSYYLTTDESGCTTIGGVCHHAGDLYQVTDAAGHISTYLAYDKGGRVTRSRDANGVVTDRVYHPRGWLVRTIVRANADGSASANDAVTAMEYDATGTVHKVTDADGVAVTYTYDVAHRLTDITDALGNRVHYTLNALGAKTKEETFDANGTLRRSLARSYNTLGQLVGIKDGLNHTVFDASFSDSYDGNGNLVRSADALGIQRKQGYDALDRLVSTVDNYNGADQATQNTQSVFAYDPRDNLQGVSDPDGLNTTYDYDGLNNAKALHSPDTGTSSYLYDAAGNRIQATDARGVVSQSAYDALNRITATTYPTVSANVSYRYDEANSVTGCASSYSIGRLTSVVETAVTTVYCYDARGNVVQKRQTQGMNVDTVSYTYTLADRLASTRTPDNTFIQYGRDGVGRISTVTAQLPGATNASNVATNVAYLPFGPIATYTLGNGQTITRTYDANYAVTDVVSPALNLHFARNAMGNIAALGNAPGANPAIEAYNYDPLHRLIGVKDAQGRAIETYSYNKTGDRLSKASNGLATGTYGYQAGTHWLTSIGSSVRTYDANGNTTGNSIGGDVFGYGYNDRNRMVVVQKNGQTVVSSTYNIMGQRVAKAAIANQRFAYSERSGLLGEYGTTSRNYVWLDNTPVAVVESDGAQSSMSYLHADGLDAPRVITNVSGATVWQWAYQGNPFGELAASGDLTLNLRFPGQYYDNEAGTIYNLNRFFCPECGRYIQSDPIGLGGGISTYAYVGSAPLTHVDPLGLQDGSTTVDAYCLRYGAAACAEAVGGKVGGGMSAGTAIGIGAGVATGVGAGVLSRSCPKSDGPDCYDRFEREAHRCMRWEGRGPPDDPNRWARACVERAAYRRTLCIKGVEDEPPAWSDADLR